MGNIYILTFQNVLNYGAVFQCAALYKTVSAFGNCAVLDYRCKKIEDSYKLFSLDQPLRKNIYGLLALHTIRKKRALFDQYLLQSIKRTKTYYTPDELKQENWHDDDIFICGSDQIWNTDLTGSDKSYFLDFARNHKKIAFAASAGKRIAPEEHDLFRKLLADFHAISVREKTLQQDLDSLDIKCHQIVDPVYLLSRSEWSSISSGTGEKPGSYVMIFLLQKSRTLLEAAVKYAKDHNKTPIVITNMARNRIKGVKYITQCSPSQFLSYIENADSVFTNSFHGISLSIIFNKLFYFEYLGKEHKTNSRIRDIIELFGLQKQNIDKANYPEIIDYSEINRRINAERKRSVGFLRENLT